MQVITMKNKMILIIAFLCNLTKLSKYSEIAKIKYKLDFCNKKTILTS